MMKKIFCITILFLISFQLFSCSIKINNSNEEDLSKENDVSSETDPLSEINNSKPSNNLNKYKILVIDNNNDSSVNLKNIKDLWVEKTDRTPHVDSSVIKSKSFSYGEQTIKGEYIITNYYMDSYYRTDIYKDDIESIIYNPENDRILGYSYYPKDYDEEKKDLSVSELKAWADELASELADVSDYILTVDGFITGESYCYEYVKQINGINTNDCISIEVNKKGQNYSYRGSMIGEYDDIEIPKIDFEACEASIQDKIDDLKQNEGVPIQGYNVQNYYLMKRSDGEIVLKYDLSLEIEIYDSYYNELLELFIII